jgi:hypothetical protein
METKFKVGDRVRRSITQQNNYKGTIEKIYDNGALGVREDGLGNLVILLSEEIELDLDNVKTDLDTQTETLRDRFAGQALIGLLAYSGFPHYKLADGQTKQELVAQLCYEYATAMLKAREAE